MKVKPSPRPAPIASPQESLGPDNCKAKQKDRLLQYLAPSPALDALLSDGFVVRRNVLTPTECHEAILAIWNFIEDTSSGSVDRSRPETWYTDAWPSTGYKSFQDMFQSNGAGWLLGSVRELLAERVFSELFQTKELHCSKEGFTFLRPVLDVSPRSKMRVCGQEQLRSVGEHFDQSNAYLGLQTIQSLVALEDQVEGVDGCFLCYPGSFQAHETLTTGTYRGQFPWVPLTDEEIERLGEIGYKQRRIYLNKGDVILWRSDLVHAPLPPLMATPRFRAVAYCSFQPATVTPPSIWGRKLEAYKQRRTGDHRPDCETWHSHRNCNVFHRQYFRTSPPLVTVRQAQLYGLIPYTNNQSDQKEELERALVRGVRFLPETLPVQPPIRRCEARLEYLTAVKSDQMQGQDKYLGGMTSPCGRYIYGVPGGAQRVMRIRISDGALDWIGPEYPGKFKWLRGVEVTASVANDYRYPNGCCLALPCNAPCILKVNPAQEGGVYIFGHQVLSECGSETGWLYHGGNLAHTGWVYAIPANAERVLKIHPVTDQVCLVGPKFLGKQKWYGGIIGSDSCIYGIPHNHRAVLKIDPSNDEITLLHQIDGELLPEGDWKWHGGLRAKDKIIGFPNNADRVLVINVSSQKVYTIGSVLQSGRHRVQKGNRYKYLGGALTLDERYAFLFPCDAEQVVRVDCELDEVCLTGPLLLDGENKFQNGFVGRDGCLYGIPQRAPGVLRIVPSAINNGGEDHVDIMDCGEDLVGVKDKFEGGVMGTDGCIYCIPLRSKTCVKIVPGDAIL